MVTQRAPGVELPGLVDLHEIGTLGRVIAFDAGKRGATVEGLRRVRLLRVHERDGMLVAAISPVDTEDVQIDAEAARRAALHALEAIAREPLPAAEIARAAMLPHLNLLPADLQQHVLEVDDPRRWIAALAAAVRGAP